MFPDLEETSQFLLNIFEGARNNHDAMSQYLRGADVIFQCIATNIAKPGHPFAITQQDASSAFSKKILKKALSSQASWIVVRMLWICLYREYAFRSCEEALKRRRAF